MRANGREKGLRFSTIGAYTWGMKLTVELVPKTCFCSNVRDHVSKATWDKLRHQIYREANNVCEICGEVGPRWPVECHEIWNYEDNHHIQKLIGLMALCPACHEVKHIGLAHVRGRGEVAKAHLAKVNGWTPEKTGRYLSKVKKVWLERSEQQWTLDLTFLETMGVEIKPKR